jgi:hypothetical protein
LNARAFIEEKEISKSGQEQYPAVRYKQVREEGKGLTPFLKKEWRGERATWNPVTVVQRI